MVGGCFFSINKMGIRGIIIQATIQAKVWRNQMSGKHKDTIVKELLRKLENKYTEIPASERRYIAIKVI